MGTRLLSKPRVRKQAILVCKATALRDFCPFCCRSSAFLSGVERALRRWQWPSPAKRCAFSLTQMVLAITLIWASMRHLSCRKSMRASFTGSSTRQSAPSMRAVVELWVISVLATTNANEQMFAAAGASYRMRKKRARARSLRKLLKRYPR